MEQWLASTITVSALCYFLIVLVLSFQAFNLCEANNRWGIILFTLVLPVIGTFFGLVYFQKHYQLFTKRRKKGRPKNKKHKKTRT
ncbi:MAG: hypothetical protein REH79_02530 [Spiroplasma sp.]|nr:hypothetical protein [Spiroplasma sp.]